MYASLLVLPHASRESRPEECVERQEHVQTRLVVAHFCVYGGQHEPHPACSRQPNHEDAAFHGENQALIVNNLTNFS